MPTTLLTIGPLHTLIINEVYALPARRVVVLGSTTAIETSNLIGSGFAALTGATTGAETNAQFLRATTTATVILKAL